MSIKLKATSMKVKRNGVYEDVGMIIGNVAKEIDDIRAAGAAQVASVNSTGAAQVEAVEAKGAETLDSIPDDYTELSNKVGGLKEDLSELDSRLSESIIEISKVVNLSADGKRIMDVSWTRGTYNNGVISSRNNRVSSSSLFYADDNFYLSIADGFSVLISYANADGSYAGNARAWVEKGFSVSKGTYFFVTIRRLVEESSEIADVNEFSSKIMFLTGIMNEINNINYKLNFKEEKPYTDVEKLTSNDFTIENSVRYNAETRKKESYNNRAIITIPCSDYDVFIISAYEVGNTFNGSILYFDADNNILKIDNSLTQKENYGINSSVVAICPNGCRKLSYTIVTTVSHDAYAVKNSSSDRYGKPNHDKVGLIMGDSIIEFSYGITEKIIGRMAGITVHNIGVAASTVCANLTTNSGVGNLAVSKLIEAKVSDNWAVIDSAVESMKATDDNSRQVTTLKAVDMSKVDFILIAIGTNDFKNNRNLGTSNDSQYNTFYGAIQYVINTVCTNYPNIRLFFASPMFRDHFENNDGRDSDHYPNNNNVYLYDFVNAEKEVCRRNHIAFKDMYYESGINNLNKSYWQTDGLHLTQNGYEKVAKIYGHFVIEN